MARHLFRNATPEGEKLRLTYAQEHTMKVVYRKDETKPGRYVFAGIWNPAKDGEYPDDHVVAPFRSVFVGMKQYNIGEKFANLIGSSKDEPPLKPEAPGDSDPDRARYASWKAFLEAKGVDCSRCVTDGNFYNPVDDTAFDDVGTHTCTADDADNVVGGHVRTGTANQEPEEGEGNILLIPICQCHNTKKRLDTVSPKRTGVGFYMKTRLGGNAVEMNKFLQD